MVTVFIPNRCHPFGSDHGYAVAFVSFAVSLGDADPAIGPNASDEVSVSGVRTDYLRATWSEDSIERFDAVNSIPEKIGMMGLEFCWSHGVGRGDITDEREFWCVGFGRIAER